MSHKDLGQSGGQFMLCGFEECVSFFLRSQNGPSEIEAGGMRNREVLVFQLPTLVPIVFNLFLDFGLCGEVEDRIRMGL